MDLLIGFFLILAAGFFAGSETAVYRANWVRLTNCASCNIPGAKAALQLLDRRESTVVTILVGTSLCTVFATEIFSHFFEGRYGPASATAAVIIVIVLTVILGEYVPKAIAQAYPDRWLQRAVLPLSISRVVFAPAVFVLSGVARLLAAPVAVAGQRFTLTRQDFLAAMQKRDAESGSTRLVTNMVSRLFRFSAMKVSEVSIPLAQVRAVPHDAGMNDVLAVIREHGYSRIPVYEQTIDQVIGFIHVRDMFEMGEEEREHGTVRQLLRTIRLVPETKPVSVLMRQMQRESSHMVIVVDEYGNTAGLASMEDLLEVIIGEIRDEHEPESDVADDGHGGFIVSGSFDLDRISDLVESFHREEEIESTTVGGLVSEWLGRVPKAGESVDRDGVRLEVLVSDGLRVGQVRIGKSQTVAQ